MLFTFSLFTLPLPVHLFLVFPSFVCSPVHQGIEATLDFGQHLLHGDKPPPFFHLSFCPLSQLNIITRWSYSLCTILISSCSITMSAPIVPTSYSKPFATSSSLKNVINATHTEVMVARKGWYKESSCFTIPRADVTCLCGWTEGNSPNSQCAAYLCTENNFGQKYSNRSGLNSPGPLAPGRNQDGAWGSYGK